VLAPHRCMGHFIRFIHNRDLAAESISYAYTRQLFIFSAPPGFLQDLSSRLKDVLRLPNHSTLALASDVKGLHASLPGEYGLHVRTSRRNTRSRLLLEPEYSGIRALLVRLRRNKWFYWNIPDAQAEEHAVMTAGSDITLFHMVCSYFF